MSFIAPQFLWGLLALIPLVAAYLLKVKPRKKQTNAWFLWERIFEEKNSSSLFSKMRNFISLLLMLIAAIITVLALAQPQFSENDTRDLIIVIDRSASMNTADGEISNEDSKSTSTRLEAAKAKARDLVRSLNSGQRASLAILDKELKFITHLSNNAYRLQESIDSITPSFIPLNENAVATISQNNTSDGDEQEKEGTKPKTEDTKNHRIILITDGCGALPASLNKTSDIEIINIAEDTTPNNLGIIAADIQPNPGNTTAQCMVKIASSLNKKVKAEIELFHPATDSVGKLSEFEIKPGINEPFFFDLPNATPGEWIARIIRDDNLVEDNSVQLILRPLPTVPVTIPTGDNYFYQRCIEAFSQAGGSLRIANTSDAKSTMKSAISVFDGSVPADVTGNIIIFAPSGTSPFWKNLGKEFIVDLAIAENQQHPILRHSDINQLSFPGAKQITAPENARIIVESEQKIPLIYQINENNRSVIVVNINPAQGDFYLSPSFPVMIHDSATYLSGYDTQLASIYPTGSSIPLPEESKALTLKLDSPGLYDFTKKDRQVKVSAALLSPQESLLTSKIKSSELTNLSTGYPFSFWLIVFAIAILILESIMYHRRKAD